MNFTPMIFLHTLRFLSLSVARAETFKHRLATCIYTQPTHTHTHTHMDGGFVSNEAQETRFTLNYEHLCQCVSVCVCSTNIIFILVSIERVVFEPLFQLLTLLHASCSLEMVCFVQFVNTITTHASSTHAHTHIHIYIYPHTRARNKNRSHTATPFVPTNKIQKMCSFL